MEDPGEFEPEVYRERQGSVWSEGVEWSPRGWLTVRVLLGDRPVQGASVTLFEVPANVPFVLRDDAPGGLREGTTDAAGGVAFELPAATYRARARHGGATVHSPNIEFDPAESRITTVLLFGRGAIRGEVLDDGVAATGVPVRIYGLGPEPARHYHRVTDRAGRFEVLALPAGNYGVAVDRAQGRGKDDERILRLGVSEDAEVHFGSREALVRWRGQVVDSSGVALPGERMLRFEHSTRRDTLRRYTGSNGRFEVELPPGPWTVREGHQTAIPSQEHPALGEFRVSRERDPGDVVIPGAVLRFRPRLEVGTSGEVPPFESSSIRLFVEDGPNRGVSVEPAVVSGETLQWERLPAGRYSLRSADREVSLDHSPAGVAYELALAQDETRDLTLSVARTR